MRYIGCQVEKSSLFKHCPYAPFYCKQYTVRSPSCHGQAARLCSREGWTVKASNQCRHSADTASNVDVLESWYPDYVEKMRSGLKCLRFLQESYHCSCTLKGFQSLSPFKGKGSPNFTKISSSSSRPTGFITRDRRYKRARIEKEMHLSPIRQVNEEDVSDVINLAISLIKWDTTFWKLERKKNWCRNWVLHIDTNSTRL